MRLLLSGGGFRATLFHLGVVRYLRERGLLAKISEVYSVSGGSILAAHLLLRWQDCTGNDEARFSEAAIELVGFAQTDLRGKLLRKWLFYRLLSAAFLLLPLSILLIIDLAMLWRLLLSVALMAVGVVLIRRGKSKWSRVEILQGYYNRLFNNATLQDISPNGRPKLKILATNFTTGKIAYFDSDGVCPDTSKLQHIHQDQLNLALAVTASSAFPPLCTPVKIDRALLHAGGLDLSLSQYLTDGGVYDNLGIVASQALTLHKDDQLVVCNAERKFDADIEQSYRLLMARATRASDIMMERLSSAQLKEIESAGHYVVDLRKDADKGNAFLSPVIQRGIRNIRTDLDRFSGLEVQLLVFRGYCAARAAIEGNDGPVANIKISEKGIPIAATESCWLPIRPDNRELNAGNPIEQLKRSSLTKWGVWRSYDVFSWLNVLLLLCLLGLSFPVQFALRSYWMAMPASIDTFGDNAAVVPLSSNVGTRITDKNNWLLTHATTLRSAPDCEQMATAVFSSNQFKDYTNGRPSKEMEVLVEADLGISIGDCLAFVATESGYISQLEVSGSGSRTIKVPPVSPSDRLIVLIQLCDSKQRGLLETESFEKLVRIKVK